MEGLLLMRQYWRLLIGILKRKFHKKTKIELQKIAEKIIQNAASASTPRKKSFVMMIGLSQSGKTRLILHHPQLNSYLRIESLSIHTMLNQSFPILRDDQTTHGPAYLLRQDYTRFIRTRALALAFRQDWAVVSDSCNLKNIDRFSRLCLAKQYGYHSVIIWVQHNPHKLMLRLERADREKIRKKQTPAWLDLHYRQAKMFEPPASGEADRMIIFNSDLDDPKMLLLNK